MIKTADECRFTGTFTEKMTLPYGKSIAPIEKAFDVTFSLSAKWDGDEIIEEFVSWGSTLPVRQIGLA